MKNEIVLRGDEQERQVAELTPEGSIKIWWEEKIYSAVQDKESWEQVDMGYYLPLDAIVKIAQTWGKDEKWKRLKEFIRVDLEHCKDKESFFGDGTWLFRFKRNKQILGKMKELEEDK